MTNIERNTALAEIFGPEGYEAVTACPQGHENVYGTDVGDFCPDCAKAWFVSALEMVGTTWVEMWGEMKAQQENLAWHPEWRFLQIPKDFTVPGVLEPLVAHLGYSWIHTAIPKSKDTSVKHLVEVYLGVSSSAPFFTLRFGKLVPDGDGIGGSYETALGEALLSARASLGR